MEARGNLRPNFGGPYPLQMFSITYTPSNNRFRLSPRCGKPNSLSSRAEPVEERSERRAGLVIPNAVEGPCVFVMTAYGNLPAIFNLACDPPAPDERYGEIVFERARQSGTVTVSPVDSRYPCPSFAQTHSVDDLHSEKPNVPITCNSAPAR